jgi:purine-nucleoside phosphorylase
MQEITYPLRVLHRIGARTLLVANAAGGLHPFYRAGDLMMLDDHINLLGDNPLVGPNDERFGERFPDMSEPYSRRLQRLAAKIARKADIDLHRGVYVAVAGPNLETRAEYRMLRNLGADAVGMSTVPEVIVARHMQMEVFGISAITDECFPDALKPASFTEIVKMGAIAEPKMTRIITDLISQI